MIADMPAERIIVELKTKVTDDPITITKVAKDDPHALARDGLTTLGFSPTEIDKLLSGAPGDTPEALITHALKVSRQ